MQKLDYFIDCHHHMFTIADVPIYQTIRQAVNDKLSFGDRLKLTPLLAFYLPFFNAKHKVETLEKFMRFFENESPENVKQIVDEVQQLINGSADFSLPFTVNEKNILLTPLVMDMDLGGSGTQKQINKLPGQIKRLTDAINVLTADEYMTVKILPFVGIDPRRKTGNPAKDEPHTIDSLLAMITPLRDPQSNIDTIKNGSFIGIKLYPSLGFNPEKCKDLCKKAALKEIPITVHCQKGSLCLTGKGDDLNHPENWVEVVRGVNNDGDVKTNNKTLIINFAHFGGEDEVAKLINYQENDGSHEGKPWEYDGDTINKASWTYKIIRILKTCPGAFADISAFDYSKPDAVAALHWILFHDKQNKFGTEAIQVEDKLLWGSDYPMSLKEGDVTYAKIFKDFVTAISKTNDDAYTFPDPGYCNANELIEKFVCINPKKFLGL